MSDTMKEPLLEWPLAMLDWWFNKLKYRDEKQDKNWPLAANGCSASGCWFQVAITTGVTVTT